MSNIRRVERDQVWLLPPSVDEWLPEGHLAWFVLDVVGQLDVGAFVGGLRVDGRGGASYDPRMMLGVLLYAYCRGVRSSRVIEGRLVEDVAFRVLSGNQFPDHATVARFRRRHEEAIAGVFCQVLAVCVEAGLVAAGVVAIDSTKVEADASLAANRTRRQLVAEILAEAEAVDVAEDERWGERRGDELPPEWANPVGRGERLREALRRLDREGPADAETYAAQRREREESNGGSLPGRPPDPESKSRRAVSRERQANVTDVDSRVQRTRNRLVQGYNAQAAVSEDQVIVAAEVTPSASDGDQFQPIAEAAQQNLGDAGAGPAEKLVADAGYFSAGNALSRPGGAEPLIAPPRLPSNRKDPSATELAEREEILGLLDRGELTIREAAPILGLSESWTFQLVAKRRRGEPDPTQVRVAMRQRLDQDDAAEAYRKRNYTVEPVFGNIKANLGFRRFSRRGLRAVHSEWRLIATVHNLLKLHRHRLAPAT